MTSLTPKKMLFSSPEVGARVGAVQAADDSVVRVLGYGTRVEDSVPDKSVLGAAAEACRHHNLSIPTIRLDSGHLVWGCECHWASEYSIKNWIGDRMAITVYPRRFTRGTKPGTTDKAAEGREAGDQ